MTLSQLQALACSASANAQKFLPYLASGTAYEARKDLGNCNAGDGTRYKGRGLIQITGRNNYNAIGAALGADFINNPALLGGKNSCECTPDQLKYAALSAGWFWNKMGLNRLADNINLHEAIDEKVTTWNILRK